MSSTLRSGDPFLTRITVGCWDWMSWLNVYRGIDNTLAPKAFHLPWWGFRNRWRRWRVPGLVYRRMAAGVREVVLDWIEAALSHRTKGLVERRGAEQGRRRVWRGIVMRHIHVTRRFWGASASHWPKTAVRETRKVLLFLGRSCGQIFGLRNCRWMFGGTQGGCTNPWGAVVVACGTVAARCGSRWIGRRRRRRYVTLEI